MKKKKVYTKNKLLNKLKDKQLKLERGIAGCGGCSQCYKSHIELRKIKKEIELLTQK